MLETETKSGCGSPDQNVLDKYNLIFVSNRGPFTLHTDETGEQKIQRGGGGLVTALLSLAQRVPSTWVAGATSEEDATWREGEIPFGEDEGTIRARFVDPEPEAYEGFYQVISNPLLWFLQHSLWDFARSPTFNRRTWAAWEQGYVSVNQLFADAVVEQVRQNTRPSLVMLQDYHLYLAPRMIREQLRDQPRGKKRPGQQRKRQRAFLTHFIHIPWPGPEDWGMLPASMREAILQGLCAVDLIGFQTREDALNFIRTCESLLPGARVNFRKGEVTLQNHTVFVCDFPISIDVQTLRSQCATEEVAQYRAQLAEQIGDRQVILRIDRSEPSKNIVRGFQAFDEMLEVYPEHQGKVQFLALLVPSRLEVEEYQDYLGALMAAAGHVNARYGTSDWEPVRVLVGESYPRALAAMQLYDVLLINAVADGMNLVAKEGPIVNDRAGVMVLSERAGAHQQLGEHSLVIAPCDVSATADALHNGLTMPLKERQRRSAALKQAVEQEDINLWLCWQIDEIENIIRNEVRRRGTR